LSATPTRKDGQQPIIFMRCGPVRHRVGARARAAALPFARKTVFRATRFRHDGREVSNRPPIQEIYARLAADEDRNDLIFDDLLTALEAGRSPIVITERKDHVALLAERLSKFARNVIVLTGGMGVRQTQAVAQRLTEIPEAEERVIVATGRYLGEGFDDARLDTLFLTLPISWRGTLAQYAGRLQREHVNTREVVIYDYVDLDEPLLAKMAAKREAGYRALGFEVTGLRAEASRRQHLR
jgi:superfamily II DNA or RNA helicase